MIRERAESVLGHARIRSTPGKGTQVRISVPLAEGGHPMPIGVIVADDHAIFRQGLASLLQAEADIALLAQAANGADAWRLIESLRPDVAILDLSMPEATGIEVARRVEAAGLDTRVVLLTMHDDPSAVLQAQEAGVAGYVLKDNSFEELVQAVQSRRRRRHLRHPVHPRQAARPPTQRPHRPLPCRRGSARSSA